MGLAAARDPNPQMNKIGQIYATHVNSDSIMTRVWNAPSEQLFARQTLMPWISCPRRRADGCRPPSPRVQPQGTYLCPGRVQPGTYPEIFLHLLELFACPLRLYIQQTHICYSSLSALCARGALACNHVVKSCRYAARCTRAQSGLKSPQVYKNSQGLTCSPQAYKSAVPVPNPDVGRFPILR